LVICPNVMETMIISTANTEIFFIILIVYFFLNGFCNIIGVDIIYLFVIIIRLSMIYV